jgi:hypothetical protein
MTDLARCPACGQRHEGGVGQAVRCACRTEFVVVSMHMAGQEATRRAEVLRLGWRRASDIAAGVGRVAMIADGSGVEAALLPKAWPLEWAARDYLRRYDCSHRPWLAAALYESGARVDGVSLENDGRGWHVRRRSVETMAIAEVVILCDWISVQAQADEVVAAAYLAALRGEADSPRVILRRFLMDYEARAGRVFELE